MTKSQTSTIGELEAGNGLILYLEDSKIGMGDRYLLVLAVGRKWLTLFYPPTLQTLKLTLKSLGTIRRAETLAAVNPKYWRKLIKDKMATFDKYQIQYSKVAAELALKVLRDDTHSAASSRGRGAASAHQ